MSQQNVELIRRGFEAFNARDVEGLVAVCHSDCEWMPFRAQLEGIVYRGHDGIRRFVADMDQDWNAFRIDPVEFHDRGPRVVVIGRLIAAGRGSGVEVDSLAGFVFDVRDGRIALLVSHSDPAVALAAVAP